MLEHKGTQDINTNRLYLRRFIESDAKMMFDNWAKDDDVTKYLTWQTHENVDASKAIITEWISSYENIEYYQWAIVLKESNEVIGSISVVNHSNVFEHCEIGYCIGKKYWDKGIITEAMKALIKYLFDQVGFERISAFHDIENIASGKVMKNAGMQYEGRMRNFHKNRNGDFVDCDSYAILKDDNRGY